MTLEFGPKGWFVFIILILLLTDITIILNIPFLRQIFGFLFLTVLPGLLILQILKLNKIGFAEKIVLSVGLSISFLMFFGLLINNLSLSLGHETPLSAISLLIPFNLALIVLAIVGHKINKTQTVSLPNFNLTTSEKAFLAVPVLFPALSILGTHLMKTADNNIILILLLFLIPTYVVFVCFFNHRFPKRLYPVVIFSISISLLLIFMLRFPHICGHDVHTEYGIYFQTTLDNLHWSVFGSSTLDACLSISLLPTIFQSILNINAQEYLFKGVYVSICSFGPLAVYVLSKKYIGELYAFLASFFFISQSTFLSVAGSPRTNVAIFFLALAVMVFFHDKIEPVKRKVLFIVFMASCIVSHYSTTYIFFFIMLFSWSAMEILSRRNTLKTFKKSITLTLVLLFFAFIFFWYSQVTGGAFNSGVGFVKNTFMSLNNLFIEESRTPAFNQLAGEELTTPILSRVHLAVTWCTFIFIGIGVLTMLMRYKEMIVISNINHKKPDFLKTKFEMEYLVMALACVGLLVIMVALPFVSVGYGIQRLYSLVIIILSVCFVIGGMTLSHFLSKERTCAKKVYENIFSQGFCEAKKLFGKAFLSKKRFVLKEKQKSLIRNFSFIKKQKGGRKDEIWKGEKNASNVRAYLLILLILIPYSMFVTGVMYQIFGTPGSLNLNSEGEIFNQEYIYDSESCAAKWLAMNVEKNIQIYTTGFGISYLISQGKIAKYRIDSSSFPKRKVNGYIYLYYNNVVDGKIITDYSDSFIGTNKIYNSGGSEIWKT